MLEKVRPFLSRVTDLPSDSIVIGMLMLAGIAVVSVLVYYVTKWLLVFVEKIILRSPTEWDDDLVNARMLQAISQLSPAMAVRWLLPGLFGDSANSLHWLSALTSLYILWAVVRILVILIGNIYRAFLKRPPLKVYAVKGVFQMIQLIFISIGIIIGLSIIIGKTPVAILTALGASAAVLMLVFQDTILGLVASIQLTANKMLQRGDWIEDKANDVNGEVLEVTLTAVKVRNWDNSVSTVPPYSLLKGSFRNYQPMRRSGGRRVERPIYIDMNTVRFCTPEELDALSAAGWLEGIDADKAAHTVNLQLLRRYLERYLSTHSEINHDMTCMVRQLSPTQSGLPLELYFFIANVEWVSFERIASDIFDHVYAVVRHFGLAIYQTPSGIDFARIK